MGFPPNRRGPWRPSDLWGMLRWTLKRSSAAQAEEEGEDAESHPLEPCGVTSHPVGPPPSYHRKFCSLGMISEQAQLSHQLLEPSEDMGINNQSIGRKPPIELITSPPPQLNCGTLSNILKSQPSVPQDVTLWGGRGFTQIIKGE